MQGLLTHVLANRQLVPFERVVKGFRYLGEGFGGSSKGQGPQVIAEDFEDPWNRGRHDAPMVVTTLASIADEHKDSGTARQG